jgi:hypothetical protein
MVARLAPRVFPSLVALVASLAVTVTVAQAHHGPTVARTVETAIGLSMTCSTLSTEVQCRGPEQYYFRSPFSVIRPASGPLQSVTTQVDAHSNGVHDLLAEDRLWISYIHVTGCADDEVEQGAVFQFVDLVAGTLEQSNGGTVGPAAVGECTMTGALSQPAPTAPWRWAISSQVTAGAFPTPTPRPPTPPPRVITPPPTHTPAATPTASPTPSPTATAPPTPTPTASVSPEGSVAGITFESTPSAQPPDPAPADDDWVDSVANPGDISTEPAAIASSALLAFLLLLFMGFVGELFNNTAKANYDVIVGWWAAGWLGRRLRWFTDFWKSP